MSAYTESLRERIKRTNPDMLAEYDEFVRFTAEISKEIGEPIVSYFITEDMTEEEAKMEIIESHLKQGSTPEEAEVAAEEIYRAWNQWQKEWEEEDHAGFQKISNFPEISGTA